MSAVQLDFHGMVESPAQAETSKVAAERIAPTTGRLRLSVLRAIIHNNGLTDEEGIAITGISPSTYRPRRVELWKGWRDFEGDYVRDSGRRRLTASGRSAIVWEATRKGLSWREFQS